MQDKSAPEQKNSNPKDSVNEAYVQAEKDIEKDLELNLQAGPGDDLDEGELARLEGQQ